MRIFTVTPNPVLDRTLTVPHLLLNEVLRSTETRLDAGGKGFNVSRALLALGVESTALAFVGGDTGRMLGAMLQAKGVQTDFVAVGEETRTNIVITEPDGQQHVKVNEPGPTVTAAEQEQMLARVAALAQPGDVWVLAGSLPRGIAEDYYARLIEPIQARGARAVLDASGPALRKGLQARPFLAKPNALEAEQATGFDVHTAEDAARAVVRLRHHAEIVAISLGADGMVAGNGAEWVHARPPAITARNTVGAGDATVAGLLFALRAGLPFAEMVRWAVACGSAAAQRPGVDFGTHAEVAQVAHGVVLRDLRDLRDLGDTVLHDA